MHIDQETFTAFVNGDREAWGKLFELCFPILAGYIHSFIKDKHTANDIAVNVLIKIYDSRNKYESPEHLEKSLRVIAKHSAFDHKKQRKTRRSVPIDDVGSSRSIRQQIEEAGFSAWISIEFIDFARKEVENLPEQQKTAIKLSYLKEEGKKLSAKEVGERMGISAWSVYTHIREGLLKLREKFARLRFDEFK